jgi:NADH:ubiquinone oxidoreductase subunit 5 (subunit L)/multisubunit Na+/H+ antiporter MnhA subunit
VLGGPRCGPPSPLVGPGTLLRRGVVTQADLKAPLAYSTIEPLACARRWSPTPLPPRPWCAAEPRRIQGLAFLVAGAVEHETGTRDLRLGGSGGSCRSRLVAGWPSSMAALPLGGFLGKEAG